MTNPQETDPPENPAFEASLKDNDIVCNESFSHTRNVKNLIPIIIC